MIECKFRALDTLNESTHNAIICDSIVREWQKNTTFQGHKNHSEFHVLRIIEGETWCLCVCVHM